MANNAIRNKRASLLLLHDTSRGKRRPLPRLDQIHCSIPTRLPIVLLLQLAQHHKVEQEEHARRQQERCALEGYGHVRCGAPPPAVLHVDDDQGGDEARKRIEHQGQVDSVHEPDVVLAVEKAEPGVAHDPEGKEGDADSKKGFGGNILCRG